MIQWSRPRRRPRPGPLAIFIIAFFALGLAARLTLAVFAGA